MRLFKRRRALYLLAFTLVSFKKDPPAIDKTVNRLASVYLANSKSGGIAIGIIDGEMKTSFCYGVKNDSLFTRVDEHTLFEIGSLTKLFTGLMVAREATEGRINLDAPVTQYAMIENPDLRKIKIRDLVSHSSGFPRLADNFWSTVKDPSNPYISYSEGDFKEFLMHYKAAIPPGEKYEYSNAGFGLLGSILCHTHHCSYDDLIGKNLSSELGLHHTGMFQSPVYIKDLAIGHADHHMVRNWDFQDVTAGQGALRSDITDMLNFASIELDPTGNKLEKAIRLSQEVQFSESYSDRKVGIAWHIGKFDGEKYLEHNGATGGYRSYVGLIPGSKKAVVILANSDQDVDRIGEALLRMILQQKGL